MNNDLRFAKLMDTIGGMRTRGNFEYTFGKKIEEYLHIAVADKNARRIMSELQFAIELDREGEKPGKYTKLISDAIGVLEASLEKDGSVTRDACAKAEEKLMPMAADAKEFAVILCGHAHIDMNWMWSYNETVASTLATFTTMCNLMDEYPDFCFSQSQASTYKIVEEHDPELMARMRKYIKEGRWEVTAGAWVETDKNMPSGESLVNTVLYTKKYMQEVWGVPAESLEIDFSPDTFGHSRHVPEIDRYTGLKYYYHCRGLDEDYILFRYKSPSGAEVLMYREPYWYNSGITPHVGIGLPGLVKKMGGLKTGLIVYGVGDHGGGVTRRDIENAIDMMEWPVFPKIRFGTFREFFKLADVPEIKWRLPVVEHEINFLLDGCYTTQSRIKRANRMAEAKLVEAEEMSAFAKTVAPDFRYNREGFEKAWQNTLFTHFHDILTGSCVRDSRDYAMGLYQQVFAVAETEENKALRAIATKVDTSCFKGLEAEYDRDFPYGAMSEGAGAGFGVGDWRGIPNPESGRGIIRPYTVFNPGANEFYGPVEITVWDWAGDVARAVFVDEEGKELPCCPQTVTARYWDHDYSTYQVLMRIPAFGYTSIALKERELGAYRHSYYIPDWGRLRYENEYVLENENIRAEFDMTSMNLISLKDKKTGDEMLRPFGFSGLVLIDTQDKGMTAWTIGTHLNKTPVTAVKKVERFGNPLKYGYKFTLDVLNSTVEASVTLEPGDSELTFKYNVDWNERAGKTIPLLAFQVALCDRPDEFLCDVPMGFAVRGHNNHDIPALSFTAPVFKVHGGSADEIKPRTVVLRSDCKYGYRCFGDDLIMSLINTAHDPDPLPERGYHDILLKVGVSDASATELLKGTEKMMHVPKAIPVAATAGELETSGVLLSVRKDDAVPDGGIPVVSSVKLNENGDLDVRFFEAAGEKASVVVETRDRAVSATVNAYSIGDAVIR